ncbi:MAG: rhomboid family intramembrane serine protease, partial [Planctomycetota bacterium]
MEPFGPTPGDSLPVNAPGPLVLHGRRISVLAVVMPGVVCGVIGMQAARGGSGLGIYVLIVFLAMILLGNLRLFLRPPLVILRDGMLLLRGTGPQMVSPAPNVVDVCVRGRTLRVTFAQLDAVRPERVRWTLASRFSEKGIHFELAGSFFTLEQVNQLRAALGMELQSADEEAGRVARFLSALFAQTPVAFVTPTMIAANVAIFIVMVASGTHWLMPNTVSLIEWGANYGPRTLDGQGWRLLTSTFVHVGIIHILFNMWVLWHVGRLVERLVGNAGLAVAYVVSGLCGSLASVCWNPYWVSAGASGAVFGLFGALLGFLVRRRESIPVEVMRPLRNSGLAFLAFNLIFGFTVPGIDMAAHIGGLAAGFLCGLVMSQPVSTAAARGRAFRNLVVAAAGALFVALAFGNAPDAPWDVFDALERLEAFERRVTDTYNSALQQ